MLLESISTDLAQKILDGEPIYSELLKIDKSKNNKYLPIISYFYINHNVSVTDLQTIFDKVLKLENKNKVKSLQYTKRGILLNDVLYKDFITFSEKIDGEFNVHINTKINTKINIDIEPIFTNDKFDIYYADTPQKSIKLGRQYSFCISQPSNSMWLTYRMRKESTFYFIFDKTRDVNDPLHVVVYDKTKSATELTDKLNTTNTIQDPYSNKRISGVTSLNNYNKYLKENNVDINIFKHVPITKNEQSDIDKISKPLSIIEFKKLSHDELEKYIAYGHELTVEQLNHIKNNKQLLYNYLISGNKISHDFFISLNNNLQKSYLNARNIVISQNSSNCIIWEAFELFKIFNDVETLKNIFKYRLLYLNKEEINYILNIKDNLFNSYILEYIEDNVKTSDLKAWMIKLLKDNDVFDDSLYEDFKNDKNFVLHNVYDSYFLYDQNIQSILLNKDYSKNNNTIIIISNYENSDEWKKYCNVPLHYESYKQLFDNVQKKEYLKERNNVFFNEIMDWEILELENYNIKYKIKDLNILNNINKPELIYEIDVNKTLMKYDINKCKELFNKVYSIFGQQKGELLLNKYMNKQQKYLFNDVDFLTTEEIDIIIEAFNDQEYELIDNYLTKDNEKLWFLLKYSDGIYSLDEILQNYISDNNYFYDRFIDIDKVNLDYYDYLKMCNLDESYFYNDYEFYDAEYSQKIIHHMNQENNDLYNSLTIPLDEKSYIEIYKLLSDSFDYEVDIVRNISCVIDDYGNVDFEFIKNIDVLLKNDTDNFIEICVSESINEPYFKEYAKYNMFDEYLIDNKTIIDDYYIQSDIRDIIDKHIELINILQPLLDNGFTVNGNFINYNTNGVEINIDINNINIDDEISIELERTIDNKLDIITVNSIEKIFNYTTKNLFDSKILKFDDFVNELFVYKDDKKINGKYFILYKENLWIFNADEWSMIYDDINKKMKKRLMRDDLYSTIENIKDNHPYILIGHIFNNTIFIESNDFRHSEHSPDLMKLKKEINLPIKILTSNLQNEPDIEEVIVEPKEDNNRIYYHGTCVKFIDSILKTGIRPGMNNNYTGLKYDDKVFVTLNPEKALYHALQSADVNDSYPIIITCNIPDKDKLIIDYDLAREIYGDESHIVKKYGYDKIKADFLKRKGVNYKDNIENKIGIYGYLGRITPNFIKQIWIDKSKYKKKINDIYDINFKPVMKWLKINKDDYKTF